MKRCGVWRADRKAWLRQRLLDRVEQIRVDSYTLSSLVPLYMRGVCDPRVIITGDRMTL